MRDHLIKLAATGALIAGFAAAPAMAQEEPLAKWDTDGDGVLSEEEFAAGWGETRAFESMDTNNDGTISKEEYESGAFRSYDTDQSGNIDEQELDDVKEDVREHERRKKRAR